MALLLTSLLAGLASAIPHPSSSSFSTPSTPTPAAHCTVRPNGQLPSQPPVDFHFSGNVRTYYIAAEETEWDYAPSGWDNWLGVPIHASIRAKIADYLSTPLITKWKKAVYRGYTDASFSEKTVQPPWQGIQGPTIRAEVGDMVEILFLNNLATHYASMHSMGLAYSKENEGSIYELTNETFTGDAVPPGACVLYKWVVPESAAPNDDEPATMHAYHSYVSMQEDMNAGLIGPQMTYQRGKMTETMKRYREFPVLLEGTDESKSFFAAENAKRAGQNVTVDYDKSFSELMQYGNVSVWKPQMTNLLSSTKYDDAPTFYALNGMILGNLPTFEMCLNDEVIWYLYGKCRFTLLNGGESLIACRPRRRPPQLPHARQRLRLQRQQDERNQYAPFSPKPCSTY